MSNIKTQLLRKIKNNSAIIGVVGLGYVGLPLSLRFSEAGFKVVGFDISNDVVSTLAKGFSHIKHIDKSDVRSANNKGFIQTSDFSQVSNVDVIIICVPTPLNQYREPDLSFVSNTINNVLPYLKNGHLISLESTTYPGTTEEVLLPKIEEEGFKVGKDIFLVYSPEREDPGNINFNTKSIPKIIGGFSRNCLEVGEAIYSKAVDRVIPVSSLKAAEMTKLLENIHRAVNIGLVNEMKIVADKMGIDIYEVIDAAATKPFGFTPYYPGPGLGGHCIPIDPFYLTWKAREYNVHTRFIELAGEVNSSMPQWELNKIIEALNSAGKSLKGSKILVLGISYKKNIDDVRESPSIEIMDLLKSYGAKVSYSDPFLPKFPEMRRFKFNQKSVQLNVSNLKSYDLVFLATDHDDFDYELIKKHSKLIVDSRGRFRKNRKNIVKG